MSSDLTERMHAAPGPATPPSLDGVWSTGQRRRRNRQLARAAIAAAAFLLVVGAAWAAGRQSVDDPQRVGSGLPDVVTATTLPAEGARCIPGPTMEDTAPSDTAADFVTTSSGQARTRVEVVARAKVVRSWWLDPTTVGPGERSWQHRIELEVTDPIKGADVGDRITVFDAIGMSGPGDSASAVPAGITGASCHFFTVGNDVIVSLTGAGEDDVYELAGRSAFFLIERGRFAPALDAARRSLGWDGELTGQARELAPEPFMDLLRDAAAVVEAEDGDSATWTVSPDQGSDIGSTFTAMVTRTGCAGGETGRVLRPGVEVLDLRVVVTFTVEPLPEGTAATCPGNDSVPVEVDLGEPLGTRLLIDGGCADGSDADGTAACLPNGQRWPR